MEQDTATGGGDFAPTPLDDILRPDTAARSETTGGQPAAPAAPQAGETGEATQPAPETKDGPPRDPTGRFAPKPPGQAAPATGSPPAQQDGTSPQTVPTAVLVEERRKRQAIERELQELRAKVAPAPQAAPQPPAAPQVNLAELMFSDPDTFVRTIQEQQEQALVATRIATSEAMARQQPDYDAAEAALTAYAQSSPAAAAEVAQMLRRHPAPAMWAYQAGKHLMAQQRWQPIMQQHGDPEAWINAEVERRIAAARGASPAASAAPPKLPGTLADVRSAGTRAAAQSATVTPLDEIARFKG